jgi:hypothetical protein
MYTAFRWIDRQRMECLRCIFVSVLYRGRKIESLSVVSRFGCREKRSMDFQRHTEGRSGHSKLSRHLPLFGPSGAKACGHLPVTVQLRVRLFIVLDQHND